MVINLTVLIANRKIYDNYLVFYYCLNVCFITIEE